MMVQPVPNPVDYTPIQQACGPGRSVPRGGQEGGRRVRQLRGHHRHQGQGRGDATPSSASTFLRLRPGVQHRRRGRLEAVRPAAEGLRRRGRVLLRLAVPELREPPRRRRPARLPPDLVHRRQLLRRSLRRLERRAATPTTSTCDGRLRPAVRGRRRARPRQQYIDIVEQVRRRHQPARRAGRLGLPAVGHRGQGVRLRPHPGLRDGQARRGPRAGPAAASTPRPTPVATTSASAATC